MEGWSERPGEGASIYRKCAYFLICGLMKQLKSSVKMTHGLRREGEKLERNMQNKLGRRRKAARIVAKRGRGGERKRGS